MHCLTFLVNKNDSMASSFCFHLEIRFYIEMVVALLFKLPSQHTNVCEIIIFVNRISTE